MLKYGFTHAAASAAGALLLLGGSATAQEEEVSVPEEVVIAEQQAEQKLADDLIGLPVLALSADGTAEEQVGTVDTLLFDENDAIAGVVVGIGGFLGFGAKSVAISYGEVDVQEQDGVPTAAFIELTRPQLENAPDFKTQAALEAEREMEQQQLEQQQQQQQQEQF